MLLKPGDQSNSTLVCHFRSANGEESALVSGWLGFASRWTFYIGPDGKIAAIDKETKNGKTVYEAN